jgi:hypothetical protein
MATTPADSCGVSWRDVGYAPEETDVLRIIAQRHWRSWKSAQSDWFAA